MRRIGWTLSLLALLACEDEPHAGALFGQVVQAEDGQGYGPVAIVLYDLETLQVIDSTVSDDEGGFSFRRLPDGDYTPVVYDERRVVFHLEYPRYRVRWNETVVATIPMTDADFYADTGVFLEGNVLDRADDEPIAHAVVEVSDFNNPSALWLFSQLNGRSGPLVAVTDEAGFFRIGPMPVILDGQGGQFVPHVRIHHPLYLDTTIGPWDRFQIPSSRNVRMDRGADSGVITGELRYLVGAAGPLSEPAVGIPVAIEWRATPGRFPKQLLSVVSARSDEQGRFRFDGLPAGNFTLLPAYEPDDGFVGEWGRSAQLATPTDSFALAVPLAIARAVQLTAPADGSTPATMQRFDWEDVEQATSYYFAITRGEDLAALAREDIALSQLDVDGEMTNFLAGGTLFRWGVIAYGESGELTRSERSFLLRR